MRINRRSSMLHACIGLLFLGSANCVIAGAPIQIMPLGDSITDGYPIAGGYRTELNNDLAAAGVSFKFVGSATDNNSTTLINAGQINHEGHSGYRIDQISNNLTANDGTGGNNGGYWLSGGNGTGRAAVSPDYILLLIGTNDFGQNFDPTHAINRLDSLIGQLANDRPNAHIIVSNLLIRTDNPALETEIQTEFNPYVPGIVSNHQALGQKVTFVDLQAAVPPTDLADGLHPNQAGYNAMGDAWFNAIQSVPEPSSLAMLGLGAGSLLIRRRQLIGKPGRADYLRVNDG